TRSPARRDPPSRGPRPRDARAARPSARRRGDRSPGRSAGPGHGPPRWKTASLARSGGAFRPSTPRTARPSLLETSEDQTCAGSAEAEGVRGRDADGGAARLAADVVELALGVGVLEVSRRREQAGLERADAKERLERAGGAEQMAGQRLRRRHGEPLRVAAE